MKWTGRSDGEPITGAEFMKINSHNFIENEKFNCERNVGKIESPPASSTGRGKDGASTSHLASTSAAHDKAVSERRTMSETVTLTKSRTDFTGSSPKRYTVKCYIKPTVVPYWYTESVLLKIGSTKKVYTETVHFKNKLVPIKWSENMSTEVKTGPKCIMSEDYIPLDDESEFHYISLIPQQEAARTPTTSL